LQDALEELADAGIDDIAMTAVSFTNALRGAEALKRRHARFVNKSDDRDAARRRRLRYAGERAGRQRRRRPA
jgi:hypothetical protein